MYHVYIEHKWIFLYLDWGAISGMSHYVYVCRQPNSEHLKSEYFWKKGYLT